MERRELLEGAAIGVGAATLGACLEPPAAGPPPRMPPPLGAPEDMDAFCAGLEQNLTGISESKFVEGFVQQLRQEGNAKREPLSGAAQARIEAHEALFRRSLHSLYLTQTFRDLPESAQRHPRLQALMHQHLPEVDQTVFDVTEMLEKLSPEERRALRSELGQRPNLPVQISEAIDEQAAAAGVSKPRRRQLRAMLTQASFRLRHAAPDVLIDEYTAKVRRATAPGGAAQALELEAAARATEELFFAGPGAGPAGGMAAGSMAAGSMAAGSMAAGSMAAGSGSRAPGTPSATTSVAGASPTGASRPRAPALAAKRQRTGVPRQPAPVTPISPGAAGTGTMRTGAWMLGIGVVTFTVSAIVVAVGGTALLVGMTVGALLFAIGLVVLLMGALTYAAS